MILGPQEAAGAAVGGKARALAALGLAGFPVPPWFVLTPDAFWDSLTPDDRRRIAHTDRDDDLVAAVIRARPSAEVQHGISRGIAVISTADARFAVRSSASDEDGAAHSFAGQLDSFLHVAADQVAQRVAAVWHSGFSTRILAYRRHHELSMPPPVPAVLVQRMVDARVSGVAFSADPVSGRRAVAVVSAVPGLGTAIVSGECDADTWQIDRPAHADAAPAILDRQIADKRRVHRPDPAAPDGVAAQELDDAAARAPALTDDEVRAVAALARRAAAHFGRPQDIEWAYEGSTLWLLQSRPITSLASLADPGGERRLWDNSNIVESYSGVTTPLTFSFASEIYEHVYRQFCRILRVPPAAIARSDEAFRNLLGLIRGRMYYNLINWYRVLALLPGFRTNRRFMEQMMGVAEALPSDVVAEIEHGAASGRWRDLVHITSTVAGLIAQHATIDRRVRSFYARLDAALVPPAPALADRTPDELAAHYRDLRSALLLAWDAPLVNDFFAMIFYGLLRRLCTSWCGDTEGTLQNDLVGGQGGLVSAEPAARLERLASLAAGAPGLAARLATGARDEIEAALVAQPAFAAEYQAYLDKFGERSVNELKLETETLHDDPLPLLRAIGHLAQRDRADAAAVTSGQARREAAVTRVAQALAWRPLRRVVFSWVLRHARVRVRDRENLRLERTQLFGRVRRIFVELGRRLHANGVLDDPRDIFYLEVDEVLAFVEGRAASAAIGALAHVRRQEFREYEETPAPPSRFETFGSPYYAHTFTYPVRERTPATDGETRQGQGCCPGVVRGPVRVVRDPRAVDLGDRAILVAEHTDPGWILIFPSAIGVLVERGSLLSHAAIVTRELGIPSIVALPRVTEWLNDGDWVEMDGSTGIVRKIGAS
jgi:pyruvate,water dikinase